MNKELTMNGQSFGAKQAGVMVSERLFEEIIERIHQLKPVGIGYG